jgi:hypothetical protein
LNELKAKLHELGLRATRKKKELANRLNLHYEQVEHTEEDHDEEEDDDFDDTDYNNKTDEDVTVDVPLASLLLRVATEKTKSSIKQGSNRQYSCFATYPTLQDGLDAIAAENTWGKTTFKDPKLSGEKQFFKCSRFKSCSCQAR